MSTTTQSETNDTSKDVSRPADSPLGNESSHQSRPSAPADNSEDTIQELDHIYHQRKGTQHTMSEQTHQELPTNQPNVHVSSPDSGVGSGYSHRRRNQPKKKSLVIGIIAALIIGGVIAGAIFVSQSSSGENDAQPSPTPTATSTPNPSPSPEPEAKDLSEYAVQVLNGSGVVGQAGVVRDTLASEGFEDLDTDNADSYDYEDTEVQVKDTVPNSVYEVIKTALSDYTVIKSKTSLEDDNDFDVIIIVGATKTGTSATEADSQEASDSADTDETSQ